MAYTFTQLQAEVFARGMNYLNDGGAGATRVQNWINQAYREINDADDWSYLESSASGPAPLSISDLGKIESVRNVATLTKLSPADRRDVTDVFVDLTITGVGLWYYITLGSVVNVYPADASSVLTVNYWKNAVDLSAGSDVPLIPSPYQELIVLGALRRGFLEDTDAGDYQAVVGEFQLGLAQMREALMHTNEDVPSFISMRAPHEGY